MKVFAVSGRARADRADPAASTVHGVVFEILLGWNRPVNIDMTGCHALRTAASRAAGPPAGKISFCHIRACRNGSAEHGLSNVQDSAMKVRNSLKSLRGRHRANRL